MNELLCEEYCLHCDARQPCRLEDLIDGHLWRCLRCEGVVDVELEDARAE